jgi:hypothetical protein
MSCPLPPPTSISCLQKLYTNTHYIKLKKKFTTTTHNIKLK